jgi:hypothetical protein
MTNGNHSDRNRVQRSSYETQNVRDNYQADGLNNQTTPTPVCDEEGRPIAAEDSVNARSATSDEVAYRNGYVAAQNQQRIQADIQRTRAENSAATGTVIGILIASIAGLVLAALYFTPQRQPQVAPDPTARPAQPQADPTQPQGTNRTTIIERVREVPVQTSPNNTEIIVTPSSPQPVTQPNPAQPNLIQPAPSPSADQVVPDGSVQVSPDSSVTNPVDPAIPVDPNQSFSQPNPLPNGTSTGQ